MSSYALRTAPYTPPVWPRWIFDTLLWVLFLGPIIAPLFRATGLPLVADAGLLARDLLATYICPTPDRSYLLLGLPMAVCARCWGATIGLWGTRLLVSRNSERRTGNSERRTGNSERRTGNRSTLFAVLCSLFLTLPWPVRLLLCALPFLLWPIEIVGAAQGWWYAPLWLLLLNGVQAGFAAGLFFCSVWPGMWPRR